MGSIGSIGSIGSMGQLVETKRSHKVGEKSILFHKLDHYYWLFFRSACNSYVTAKHARRSPARSRPAARSTSRLPPDGQRASATIAGCESGGDYTGLWRTRDTLNRTHRHGNRFATTPMVECSFGLLLTCDRMHVNRRPETQRFLWKLSTGSTYSTLLFVAPAMPSGSSRQTPNGSNP